LSFLAEGSEHTVYRQDYEKTVIKIGGTSTKRNIPSRVDDVELVITN
jgi:hypothetical protein